MADVELVIKIPKSRYRLLQKQARTNLGREKIGEFAEAVLNGTPLPKGHGYLIDANRKITVTTYDEQYEEWGQQTMTILEALNKWSDEGVTVEDVIIPANKEGEDES